MPKSAANRLTIDLGSASERIWDCKGRFHDPKKYRPTHFFHIFRCPLMTDLGRHFGSTWRPMAAQVANNYAKTKRNMQTTMPNKYRRIHKTVSKRELTCIKHRCPQWSERQMSFFVFVFNAKLDSQGRRVQHSIKTRQNRCALRARKLKQNRFQIEL